MTPNHLKALRAKLGLTQAALATQLGVTRNSVTRWEMGLHPISLMVVKFIALLTRRT